MPSKLFNIRHLAMWGGACAAAAIFGCSETRYELISRADSGDGDAVVPGDGDGVIPGDGDLSGDGDVSQCEGAQCPPGDGSGGNSGMGGEPSVVDDGKCESIYRPNLRLFRLRMERSGGCIVVGEAISLVGQPAYTAVVIDCAETRGHYWSVYSFQDQPEKIWEFRNDEVGMNLDVQFAGTATGTPIVLYAPLQLMNQRFILHRESEEDELLGQVQLSPSNAETQCLTEISGRIELQPCDPSNRAQFLRVLPCTS